MNPRAIALAAGADQAGFRLAVRRLLATEVPPDAVIWTIEDQPALFAPPAKHTGTPPGTHPATPDVPPVMLSRAVAAMVAPVVCHRDPQRYASLYRLIWRVRHGEPGLLDNPADPLVHRLEMMRKAIRRDLHKMHAFVRFREIVATDGTSRFVAWFEPDHYIVEATADFFVERFPGMDWTILTPVGSLHWDTERLAVGGAGDKAALPASDSFEVGWCSYYESIFNPARLNPAAMRTEMAGKYWHNMPEAALIPELIRNAPARVQAMVEREAAMPIRRDPERAVAAMDNQNPKSLAALNRIIATSPPLVPGATQAVLGEGPIGAAIAFVGEQPGDAEDIAGRPFVGPAGQVFDRALNEAGIERPGVYITNAVKHFKFEQRGKRRMHASPTAGEVQHYRWWLMQELDFVQPRLVVALGATALLALAGKAMPLLRNRGPIEFGQRAGFVTVHPSYILRLADALAKRDAYASLVTDLQRIRDLAAAWD